MDEIIEVWFAHHFHGLGLKLDAELHNHIHAAKEDLKVRLAPHAPAVDASVASAADVAAPTVTDAEEA